MARVLNGTSPSGIRVRHDGRYVSVEVGGFRSAI